MAVKIKICGLTEKKSIDLCCKLKIDYLGFVFFEKSPRSVNPVKMLELANYIEKDIAKVAVTVDASDDYLDSIFNSCKFEYVQCHGQETVDRIKQIKQKYNCKIIKAIKVKNSDDVASAKKFEDVSDHILFDAKAPSSPIPGGNGLSFDWSLLKNRNLKKDWFLSGGLNHENIKDAIIQTNPPMVDVSSSLESLAGIKDLHLIQKFVNSVITI